MSDNDPDFWKNLYRDQWKKSGSREEKVLSLLKEAGFKDAKLVGFGAGSEEFFHGKAEKYGRKKGDPDIDIPSVGVSVEVTGTDVKRVNLQADLWVRPDKVENARDHRERDTWVVHSLDHEGTLRAIHLDGKTIDRLLQIEQINTTMRRTGVEETYIPIRANDPNVKPFTDLVSYLKEKRA